MGTGMEQRSIETSRLKLEAPGEPAALDGPDEPTDPGLGGPPQAASPWQLNQLGLLLAVLLLCSLVVSVALALKLSRTRAELAEAEAAAEMAGSALAREPEEQKALAPAPAAAAPGVAPAARAASAAPAREERLLILLTVGTQRYAEKQLRSLKTRCKAPLAVYRQTRGRCGWDQCFAVALPASEAERARGCGQVKGQALRDRADFVLP